MGFSTGKEGSRGEQVTEPLPGFFFSMSWAVHALSFLFCLTQKGSVCKQLLCSFISWLFLIAKSKSPWWSQIWNRQRSIGCGDHTMDIRG